MLGDGVRILREGKGEEGRQKDRRKERGKRDGAMITDGDKDEGMRELSTV